MPPDSTLRTPSTSSDFEQRLSTTDPTDPEALYLVALWARENQLLAESRSLLEECIVIDPDFAPAREALGHVAVDGQWYPVAESLAIARGWWAAGLTQRTMRLLSRLRTATQDPRLLREILTLSAEASMAARDWDEVSEFWSALIKLTREPPERARLEAQLASLDENPDGLVLVFGHDAPGDIREVRERPTGFYELQQTWVMQLELSRYARQAVAEGQAALVQAASLQGRRTSFRLDRRQIETALRKAEMAFDRADALRDGIAESHRLELARRRIGLLRQEAEWHAARFDETLDTHMADEWMSASAKRSTMIRMLGQLKRVVASLETVLIIAETYPDELDLEIQWTRLDLERVRGHQRAVKAALDAMR